MKKSLLKVSMLGGITIEYEKRKIPLPLDVHSIPMQFLLILWYMARTGISRDILLNWLYEEREINDPANSMRVNVYRLRKILGEFPLPSHEYIVVNHGMYYWDSGDTDLEVDANEFSNCIRRAQNETVEERQYALLRKACGLYNGDFLPALASERWAAIRTVEYQKTYLETVKALYSYYIKKRMYDQAVFIVDQVMKFYTYETFAAMKIDALMAEGSFQKALDTLDDVSRTLFTDLGVMPSGEILKRYELISSRISSPYSVAKEIETHFDEETITGAYYCAFPSFVDCYRVLNRLSVRNGTSIFLVDCYLTDSQGSRLESGSKMIENIPLLMKAVEKSLRAGDIYTRSNDNQLFILLSGLTQEDCSIVMDRIRDNFQVAGKVRGIKVDFLLHWQNILKI